MNRHKKQSHFPSRFTPNNAKIALDDRVLWLKMPNCQRIFWDPNAFRPELTDILEDKKEYGVNILFDSENLSNGELIKFPRRLVVNMPSKKKTIFVNVR